MKASCLTVRVAVYRGRILGITPKTYLPNYREFYEKRQFTSGRDAVSRDVILLGTSIPFGSDIVYAPTNVQNFALHVEICEDVLDTHSPLDLGRSGRRDRSREPLGQQHHDRQSRISQRPVRRSVRALRRRLSLLGGGGRGESTTDLAWDGHALIYENNELLAEATRFAAGEQIIAADIDLERLVQDRMRLSSFNDTAGQYQDKLRAMRRVPFEFTVPAGEIALLRRVERFPYVPNDDQERDARCFEAYNIQVHGLMKRLASTNIEKIVIGVSGGLDSTQALIVAARTMDRLGLPRRNILAYTLPGFATGETTKKNAWGLMRALGVSAEEIDIRPSCLQMLRDIGHPFRRRRTGLRYHIRKRTGRPNGLRISSGWRTSITGWCWARAISASWRSDGPRTASATRCRTTMSTCPCPRP